MERGAGGVGDRDRHRRPAPGRPALAGLGARRDRSPGALLPAEHGRVLHGTRRGQDRPARPRGVRDRLDQARGDRRRPHPPPRRGRACRTPPRPWSPTGSPCCPTPTTTRSSRRGSRASGCAAVMPLGSPIGSGAGIRNPYNVRLIVEARERAGDPRRRGSARPRTRRWRWSSAARACCWRARSRGPRTRSRWRSAMRKAVEAGLRGPPRGPDPAAASRGGLDARRGPARALRLRPEPGATAASVARRASHEARRRPRATAMPGRDRRRPTAGVDESARRGDPQRTGRRQAP